MIIFNTTFHIDEVLNEEFVEYILQRFIPMSTKSGILNSARFARIFGSNEDEGLSYAMEFQVGSIDQLDKCNKEESKDVFNPLMEKFKEKLIGFSTVMQTVDY